MFQNYLKITIRQMLKNSSFSLLNIVGLSMGVACATLILIWAENELTYDAFHANGSRIYQIMNNQTYEGKTYTFAATPGPLRDALLDDVPEIEHASRTDWGGKSLISYGDKNLYETGYSVEPDFFNIFSFPLIKGDAKEVFQNLHSIVITTTFAKKYFGDENPIGKVLRIDNNTDFQITGLVADPPINSTIQFGFLKSFEFFLKHNSWAKDWNTNGMQTFVALHPNSNQEIVNHKLDSIVIRHHENSSSRLFLFSMNDWRLRNEFEDGKITGGRIEHVRLFCIIAAFILLIACINFMNLSTARSERRAREVGVRKVLGAERYSLISQFLGESLLMALVAVAVATVIVKLALPGFNILVAGELSLRLSDPLHLGGLLAVGLISGLLAGSYPAFYLSSFQPIKVIKGMSATLQRTGKGGLNVRKALVVTQFAISSVLIISTMIIFQQIKHVKSRHLGFDKTQLLMMPIRGEMGKKFEAIKKNLIDQGVIENAAMANQQLVQMGNNTSGIDWQGRNPNSEALITTDWVSPEFLNTVGIKLKAGRDFKQRYNSDTLSAIINESFAKLIGRTNPTGEEIKYGDSNFRIIGVMENFLFNNMYEDPDPVVLFVQPNRKSYLFARLTANGDIAHKLAVLEKTLGEINPGYPFEYQFVDEEFDKLFRSETLVSTLARLFTGLAIFISCLGLFGLAAFTAERRTKEIGIRKVLGATTVGIVGLLSKDFLKLVFIALLVAAPLAYFFMDKWLTNFAYRIDIQWWVFVLAGLVAVLVAFFTVGFQGAKAALANPVDSLRSE